MICTPSMNFPVAVQLKHHVLVRRESTMRFCALTLLRNSDCLSRCLVLRAAFQPS